MGPGVAERFNRTVDHHAPLMFDAERTFACDLAELASCHIVLSRNFENAGKRQGLNRYDRARAAFAEENGFCGKQRILNGYDRAEKGRSMLRRYRRRLRIWSGREAGLREGDGEAAVGDVVGGLHRALGGKSNEAILETLLGS